ncbi:phage transcriptional regulator AlpA [Burkholderia pseudomallei]|uniref:helix-turn-helix transcriptional regulator n=1 Tax=Burkholderia pseudomallei TaxID=28450 RepID=UPI000F1CD1EA|nr:AlpA family phage regulatory protein [Burkholderia pseudomallei]CAJ3490108.1 phage transcriptional regulator AlpA [Burkholderia pseudomallei]CAJ5306935.1 phage transcriptional regulator AlpA [Burkholderia pseudomallei]CAJ6564356.1 phage transcriptional regulator AlpA [Burkholderia pseudomallei]CAJ8093894.1 phage transcriptional regulator AlpA [Burkholderia pseudomallei]VBM19440.1 phage transcriptional regulator AlpA [Burkholderia pseudomallei]
MTVPIELPLGDQIDCWILVREIARAEAPDLNPKAAGIECLVAKKPVPVDVPGVGPVMFVERELTNDDRAYLARVLPRLPVLQIPYSDDVIEAFLRAFRALPDRPSWDPVLLTESRYLQEQARIVEERWALSSQHLQVLQQWLDSGRIRAFRGSHVPVNELLVGTLIPRRDVLAYLDYCEIPYTGKKTGVASVEREVMQDIDVCARKAETREATAVPEPRRVSQSVRSADRVALGQPEVVKQEPSERLERQVQAAPASPLLDIKQVSELVNISVSMLHEKMKPTSKYYDPTFPPKIQLTERTVRYSQVDVAAWIQAWVSGPSAAGETRGREGVRAEQGVSKFPSPNNPGENNASSDCDLDGDDDRLRDSGLLTAEIVRLFSRKARGGNLAETFSNPPSGLKRRAQISSLKGRHAHWDPVAVALWLHENRTDAYPTRVLAEIFEYETLDLWRPVWADEAKKLERRRGAR